MNTHFKTSITCFLFLLISISALAAIGVSSVSAAPTVGSNVRVTNLSWDQNEPSVAFNPTNNQKLVVGYNDYSSDSSGAVSRLGWSWSDNQGSTWTYGGMFSVLGYTRGGNPIVAFDSAGNCYYAGMVYNPYTTSSGTFSRDGCIFLAKSNDGGHTFSVFQKLIAIGSGINPSLDRPWMYINPASNYIYVAWTRRVNAWSKYPTEKMTIWFTRSTDGGVTFSTPIQIGSDLPTAAEPWLDRSHGPQIATASGNTVYVAWHTVDTGTRGASDWKPPKIWISQSTDGGVTFGASNLVATKQNSLPAMFISMAAVPESGRIYIVYCERPTSNGDLDVYVATAARAAGPWTLKRVNDDPVGNGVDQWYPVVDVAPSGRVDVIWYDYRLGSSNRHVYYSASSDHGATWEANTRITDIYGPPAVYAGDYVGCVASQGDKAIVVWGDTRISGNQEVYSAVLSIPIPSTIIVDDINAEFVGTWPLSTATSGYYGSGYRYHAAGTGANTATWWLNIPSAGSWQVYARWTSGSNRAANALYRIFHALGPTLDVGPTLVMVNQEVNGGSWQSLGTYTFKVGVYRVILSDSANEYVIADAIRLVSSSPPPPPPPPPTTLTVTSPNGGESWARGTTHAITWSKSGTTGSYVKIELLKGGVVNKVLASSTYNDGSASWTIPSTQTAGTDYTIRITSTSNPAITDSSNANFAITSGSTATITVTSPNGGESWKRGTAHTITWSKSGTTGSYVKIELLKGGVVNKVLTSSTANDGSASWTIPSTQTTGTDYKIRITSTAYPSISDSSNSNFAITT